MAFYNEKQQLYLGTDALVGGLRASLLQVRDGKWFSRNVYPNNATLWPIVFASKRLTSMKTHYGSIDSEALGILYGLENLTITVLPNE